MFCWSDLKICCSRVGEIYVRSRAKVTVDVKLPMTDFTLSQPSSCFIDYDPAALGDTLQYPHSRDRDSAVNYAGWAKAANLDMMAPEMAVRPEVSLQNRNA